jgi:hypothetical protein
MAVCIECTTFNGGDFTSGTATDYCALQIIFDGGNFTSGTTNDTNHNNTCVIDGNAIVANRAYASLDHGTIVGVKTIEKKFVTVFTRQVNSDPRKPVTEVIDGFVITKTINPKKPGEFIVEKPQNSQDNGSIYVAAYDSNNTLAWRPVLIAKVVRSYTRQSENSY